MPTKRKPKRPTKAQIETLVRNYARMKWSKVLNAPLRSQESLHNKFFKGLDRLAGKFPHIDMWSEQFYAQLETAADDWWRDRMFSGPGVDW